MTNQNDKRRVRVDITVLKELDEALTAIAARQFLSRREAIKLALIEYVNRNMQQNLSLKTL